MALKSPACGLLTSDAPDVSANMAAAVARAVGRGEIGPHPVPAHILAAPHARLRHELAIRHHRPTDAELAQIIDDITIPAIQRASHHPAGKRLSTTT